jgi:hypothetical protein
VGWCRGGEYSRNGVEQEGTCIMDGPSFRGVSGEEQGRRDKEERGRG